MPNNPRQEYDMVCAELVASSPSTSGPMFGMPCLKVHGKAYASFFKDAMVFKLRAPAHATALALSGARRFDPSERGRAMKEWVEVPFEHADKWRELARAALAYVGGES